MLIFPFEAESIAYVVCQYLGLDTSDYSFAYLIGWSSGRQMPELRASLHVRIHRQMTEEEKKEWTRERFTKWVLLNNVHGIIQDLEKKFEPLYEQQKLERFLPTRQQQDVVEHMPLGAWDNPYFEALPPEHFALFVPSQSLYVCMQTSEMEFDYTLYDSQEHILDGGRLTGNGAWTIWDAMNDLFEELEVDWKDIIVLDHDKVKDWIESGGEK